MDGKRKIKMPLNSSSGFDFNRNTNDACVIMAPA